MHFYGAVSSPNGMDVFVAGSEVAMSGMSISARSRVLASDDRGAGFKDITGAASSPGMATVTAAAFVDTQTGWVAIGRKIWRTENRGEVWTPVNVDAEPAAMKFFDRANGVFVGGGGAIRLTRDGGRTWNAVASPTDLNLTNMFWLDAARGWASGAAMEEAGLGEESEIPASGILIATEDGGRTWTEIAAPAGTGLNEIFFLCDGRTGWVAGWTRSDESAPDKAVLFKTTDGGRTLVDMKLPLAIGTMTMATPFGQQKGPIDLSLVRAMYWEDAQRGHLGGIAWLAEKQEGSSGGGVSTSKTTNFYALGDFVTADGGATWQKNDLGTIQASMQTPPKHDNYIFNGVLVDLWNGWMVGDTNSVWRYEKACADDAACGAGYGCWRGRCLRRGTTCCPACGSGDDCVDGVCEPAGGNNPGGGGGGQPDAGDEREGLKFVGMDCGCGVGAGAWAAAALLVLVRRRVHRRGSKGSRKGFSTTTPS